MEMVAQPEFAPGGGMIAAATSAVLFAAAASVATHHTLTPVRPRSQPVVRGRQRAVLLDAVGPVAGTEQRLVAVARARVLAVCAVLVVGTVVLAVRHTTLVVLALFLAAAAAWQVPLIVARSQERLRRRVFDVELTDALGEMVMGVEAGLTLESVMQAYSLAHVTSLGAEFAHVLDLINIGVTRMDALTEFQQRTPTTGVRLFVAAVQQNQKLGTPLADVLRQQGETARRRRRQSVEEYSAKLSLKMIFPTVFCILPMLLIVIVGPAIVRLVHALPK